MNIIRYLSNLWEVTRKNRQNNTQYDIGRNIEYVLRLVPFYYWVRRLLSLFNNPRLQFIPERQPAVLGKVRKPYQDRTWSISRRFKTIRYHYLWLLEVFDQAQLISLYEPEGLLVTTINMPNGNYAIKLLVDKDFDKEGELSLAVFNEYGDRLAILTFSIMSFKGKRVMIIGGLQGGKDVATELKKMAKDCSGLRVMALLVHAAQFLANHFQLHAVYAICDARHVYHHRKYRGKKEHQIQRTYDDLWVELGGVFNDAWYELPLNPKIRDLADAPTHKRAMYARRGHLLISLEKDIARFCSETLTAASKINPVN
ncbi:MAG: VirK/YbjX family protein [Aquirhabdus sp.]